MKKEYKIYYNVIFLKYYVYGYKGLVDLHIKILISINLLI